MINPLNKRLRKEILRLHSRQGRRKSPYCALEGHKCLQEALAANVKIEAIIYHDTQEITRWEQNGICKGIFHQVSERELKELSFSESSQGTFALAHKPPNAEAGEGAPFIPLLDRISDPGNMGTILRTCLAAGLKEVWLTRGCADLYSDKCIRAAMGAQFHLRLVVGEELGEMLQWPQAHGRQIWLTCPEGGISLYDKKFTLDNSLLVFGEEGGGISDKSQGGKVQIPMPGGFESLNVAQAATLFIFEGVRQELL